MRIVSLIPSATEIVDVLGQTASLVGRSHECDFPSQVVALPVCTEPKLRTDVPSIEIDRQVKAILKEALSVYRVFVDRLEELRPDVIITQSQCDVCAVSLKDVEAAVCQLIHSRPQIVSMEPMQLSDIWDDIHRVADALQIRAHGEAVVSGLKTRMSELAAQTRTLQNKPRVALIEWIEPMMAGGNWMPELLEIAGGVNLLSTPAEHSPWIAFEDLHRVDPDILVVLPCGFDIPRTMQEMPALLNHPEWQTLRAVKEGQVYITDGNQFFNRPGPRVVESAEILAEICHPGRFDFGHKNTHWFSLQTLLQTQPLNA